MKGLWYKLTIPLMALGVLLAWSTIPGCQTVDPAKAEAAATAYAENVPGATGKVSCTQSDSDGDGYVTCSIFREEGEAVGVECGAEKMCACNCAKGCKPLTMKIRGGSR